jgi:hypothetical protein
MAAAAPMLFPPRIVVIFFGHQVSGTDKLPAARIFAMWCGFAGVLLNR